MGVQIEQLLRVRTHEKVVHEDPHSNAPLSRAQQVIRRDAPYIVGGEDEVLHVDRLLGRVRQPGSSDHRVLATLEYVDAGLRCHPIGKRGERCAELGGIAVDRLAEVQIGRTGSRLILTAAPREQ